MTVATVLGTRRGNLQRVVGEKVAQLGAGLLTKRQVDPVGVIDIDAQGLAAGALHGDNLDLRIKGVELLLDVFSKVCHAWLEPKKKWASPTSQYDSGTDRD